VSRDVVTGRVLLAARIGIAVMVLDHVYNGVWGVLSPASYYRASPGANPAGALDALNRVLVRDMSAGRLTLAVVLVIAAVWARRDVLVVALVGANVSGVVRLADHLIARPGDGVPNWIGYTLAIVIPLVLLVFAVRGDAAVRRQ